jgi:hypothetical protein
MTTCSCEDTLAGDTAVIETPKAETVITDDTGTKAEWEGAIGLEGIATGDGRMILPNALRWDTLPIPLRWASADYGEHDGAVVVGKITKIWRGDEGKIMARGEFDLGSDHGREAYRHVKEGLTPGISMDLDDIVVREKDEDSFDITDGRIRAATQVAIPAFEGARIAVSEPETFTDYSPDTRAKKADSGEAMPDGSYPIANCEDLQNAVQSVGRASDPEATKAHIRTRAAALKCPDVSLPESFAAPKRVALNSLRFAIGGSIEVSDVLFDEAVRSGQAVEVGTREDGAVLYDLRPDHEEFNWVDDAGGLPPYIKRIQKHLQEKGMDQSRAIATAVNVVKKMCATGDVNFPGAQQVNAGSRAEACAAVADWEAKKVRAHANSAESLVAGATVFDGAWFQNPGLRGPTPLTVMEDGRVFGHIALWGTCHIASPQGPNTCTQPPHSASNYSYFKTGAVATTSGDIAVGKITLSTVHAGARLSSAATVRHYEDTGTVGAYVNAGEDNWGIWVAGAARPDVDATTLKGSPISGDWRRIGTSLELVGALAVNVPGFPVPRPEALVAGGTVLSLVASGAVPVDNSVSARLKRRRKARDLQARVARASAFQRVRRVRFAYNDNQWRVPKGNGKESGRWVDMPDLGALTSLLQDAFDNGNVDEGKASAIGDTLDQATNAVENIQTSLRKMDGNGAVKAATEADQHLSKLEAQLQDVADSGEVTPADTKIGDALEAARTDVDLVKNSDLSLLGDKGLDTPNPSTDIGGGDKSVVGDVPKAPKAPKAPDSAPKAPNAPATKNDTVDKSLGDLEVTLQDAVESAGVSDQQAADIGDSLNAARDAADSGDFAAADQHLSDLEAKVQDAMDTAEPATAKNLGDALEKARADVAAAQGGSAPDASAPKAALPANVGADGMIDNEATNYNPWPILGGLPEGATIRTGDQTSGDWVDWTKDKSVDGGWKVSKVGPGIPADDPIKVGDDMQGDSASIDGGGDNDIQILSGLPGLANSDSGGSDTSAPSAPADKTPAAKDDLTGLSDAELGKRADAASTAAEAKAIADEYKRRREALPGNAPDNSPAAKSPATPVDPSSAPRVPAPNGNDTSPAAKSPATPTTPAAAPDGTPAPGSVQQQAASDTADSMDTLDATIQNAFESADISPEDATQVGDSLTSLYDSVDKMAGNIADGNYNEAELADVQQQLSQFEAVLMNLADKPGLSDEQAGQIGQALDDLFAKVGALAQSLQGDMTPPPFATRKYIRQWLGRRGIRLDGRASLI